MITSQPHGTMKAWSPRRLPPAPRAEDEEYARPRPRFRAEQVRAVVAPLDLLLRDLQRAVGQHAQRRVVRDLAARGCASRTGPSSGRRGSRPWSERRSAVPVVADAVGVVTPRVSVDEDDAQQLEVADAQRDGVQIRHVEHELLELRVARCAPRVVVVVARGVIISLALSRRPPRRRRLALACGCSSSSASSRPSSTKGRSTSEPGGGRQTP